MKFIIIILILSFNLSSATFKFKDGSRVNGYIFHQNASMGNASPEGIFLIVNNKFYLHNYPLKIREKIIDHGDGRYTVEEEIIPTPAPPVGGLNPHQLPRCVPGRINFMHFSHETLNDLYKYYGTKAKYHKSIIDKYPSKLNHVIAFRENRNIALGVYKAASTKNFRLNSKELASHWNTTVRKEYGKNSSLITWFGN
tara:strand:- start:34 stop:624 length:591 start_codon:yes stop_codon:yes gene_type:complete